MTKSQKIIAICAAAVVALGIGTFFLVKQLHSTENIPINAESFPDKIFRAYLSENFDLDNDDVLSLEERNRVTGIDVNGKGIETLEGIKAFPNLQVLNCNHNQLTSLDVSSCTALKDLETYNNPFAGRS